MSLTTYPRSDKSDPSGYPFIQRIFLPPVCLHPIQQYRQQQEPFKDAHSSKLKEVVDTPKSRYVTNTVSFIPAQFVKKAGRAMEPCAIARGAMKRPAF
jgi:hypothetical protein